MTALPQGWPPYTPADLTPLPGAAAPPSERTRSRLLDSPHMGDAEWASVLLGAGLDWTTPANSEET